MSNEDLIKSQIMDKIDTKDLPPFDRSIESAKGRLRVIDRQHLLFKKIDRILHTFDKAFEDIQNALPGDTAQREAHQDRVCFEIKEVPCSIIYVPQAQPTFINVNKQKILAEKLFICDKYFGKNTYEMVGPSEREVGGIFVCEDTYLVRWADGRAFFHPTVYELVDSCLDIFFKLHDSYRDRFNNELVVNLENYHHKITPLDLLTSSGSDFEKSAPASDLRLTRVSGAAPNPNNMAATNMSTTILAPAPNANNPASRNIKIQGDRKMKF